MSAKPSRINWCSVDDFTTYEPKENQSVLWVSSELVGSYSGLLVTAMRNFTYEIN